MDRRVPAPPRATCSSSTHNAGFRPDVAYETEDYVAVMGLVAEGLGVALIPDLILRTVHHHDVVALPMTPASRRAIMAVTTPDLQRVPAVGATLDALAESAKGQSRPHRAGPGARLLHLTRPWPDGAHAAGCRAPRGVERPVRSSAPDRSGRWLLR